MSDQTVRSPWDIFVSIPIGVSVEGGTARLTPKTRAKLEEMILDDPLLMADILGDAAEEINELYQQAVASFHAQAFLSITLRNGKPT